MMKKVAGTLAVIMILVSGSQASADYKDLSDGFSDADGSNILAIDGSQETNDTGIRIILKIGSKDYVVNGVRKTADTAPEIVDGTTMVPVRLVTESMSAIVDWEQDTNTITIRKDYKRIIMQISNTKMVAEDAEVDLPAPPLINKDGRTIVPVRAISEAFGIPVIWVGETNSVYIGYTQAEADEAESRASRTFPSPISPRDTDSVTFALTYMAGGKFQDLADADIFAVADKASGTVVSFFVNDFNKLNQQLNYWKDGKNSVDQLKKNFIDASIIGKIRNELEIGDFVYVMNDEAYVFTENSKSRTAKPYVNRISVDGKITKVCDDADSRLYGFESIVFDKDMGVCLSDGYKINYKYNPDTKLFEELDDYIMLGTAMQRMKSHIESLAKLTTDIDPADVAKFEKSGNTDNCRTIKVYNDADGNPALCVICGGEYGLNKDAAFGIEIAVKRWNFIDRTIMTRLCDQFGLNCITVDLSNHLMQGEIVKDSIATFDKPENNGVIYFNKEKIKNTRYFHPDLRFTGYINEAISSNIDIPFIEYKLAPAILLESRGIYDSEHIKSLNGSSNLYLKDKVCETDNPGFERQAWTLRQIEIYNKQEKLTPLNEKVAITNLNNFVQKSFRLTFDEYYFFWRDIAEGLNYYISGKITNLISSSPIF